MESLAGYSSDEDMPDRYANMQREREPRSRERAGMDNYDNVQMDMSEDSNSSSGRSGSVRSWSGQPDSSNGKRDDRGLEKTTSEDYRDQGNYRRTSDYEEDKRKNASDHPVNRTSVDQDGRLGLAQRIEGGNDVRRPNLEKYYDGGPDASRTNNGSGSDGRRPNTEQRNEGGFDLRRQNVEKRNERVNDAERTRSGGGNDVRRPSSEHRNDGSNDARTLRLDQGNGDSNGGRRANDQHKCHETGHDDRKLNPDEKYKSHPEDVEGSRLSGQRNDKYVKKPDGDRDVKKPVRSRSRDRSSREESRSKRETEGSDKRSNADKRGEGSDKRPSGSSHGDKDRRSNHRAKGGSSRSEKRDDGRQKERKRSRERSRTSSERHRSRSPPHAAKSRSSPSGDSRSKRSKPSTDDRRSKRSRSPDDRRSKRSRSPDDRRSKRSRSPERRWNQGRTSHYEKKPSKLSILERLGIALPTTNELQGAVTPQQLVQRSMALQVQQVKSTTGIELPSYYNPAAMNPARYAEQIQKKRLLWGNKNENATTSKVAEAVPEQAPVMGANKWEGATFKSDHDGVMTAKFKRLMGIKNAESGVPTANVKPEGSELIKKQEEMFNSMEMQYEVARVATHTHRGLGLGFGTFQYPR